MVSNEAGLLVQGHGGADVNGNPDHGGADGPDGRVYAFDDEVFFALRDKAGLGHRGEADAAGDHILGGDGLMPEIEADPSIAGMTDDAGEEKGGGFKGEIVVVSPVARIPQDCRPGRALTGTR